MAWRDCSDRCHCGRAVTGDVESSLRGRLGSGSRHCRTPVPDDPHSSAPRPVPPHEGDRRARRVPLRRSPSRARRRPTWSCWRPARCSSWPAPGLPRPAPVALARAVAGGSVLAGVRDSRPAGVPTTAHRGPGGSPVWPPGRAALLDAAAPAAGSTVALLAVDRRGPRAVRFVAGRAGSLSTAAVRCGPAPRWARLVPGCPARARLLRAVDVVGLGVSLVFVHLGAAAAGRHFRWWPGRRPSPVRRGRAALSVAALAEVRGCCSGAALCLPGRGGSPCPGWCGLGGCCWRTGRRSASSFSPRPCRWWRARCSPRRELGLAATGGGLLNIVLLA